MSGTSTPRGGMPLLLAVGGTLAVLGGALGFARWNEANADAAPAGAYAADRERAHERLDDLFDAMERWHQDGVMPGFRMGPGGMPEGMPGFGQMPGFDGMPGFQGMPGFDLEQFAEQFGQMMGGRPLLGVSVEDGLVVAEVLEGSAAAEAGVQPGDRIVAVAGEPVADLAEVRAAIAAVPAGETYALTVERDGSEQTLTVTRPETPSMDLEALQEWLEQHMQPRDESGPAGPMFRGGMNY